MKRFNSLSCLSLVVLALSIAFMAIGCDKGSKSNPITPSLEIPEDGVPEQSQNVDSDLIHSADNTADLPEQANYYAGNAYIRKSCPKGAWSRIYAYGPIEVRFYRYGGGYYYWKGYKYGTTVFYAPGGSYERVYYSTPNNTGRFVASPYSWSPVAGCR